MSSYTEVSPNEPDIMPDYVDDKPPPRRETPRVERRNTARKTVVPEMAAALSAVAEPPVVVEAPASAEQVLPDEISEPVAAEEPAGNAGTGHRDGECVPNVPDVLPAYVSAEEAARATGPETLPEPEPVLAPSEPRTGPSPWWKWGVLGTVLVVAVFGMLVFSQAVSALALARTLPVWAQYLLLIPLGFCCLAVLYVCGSVARAWLRLRAVRQVDLASLDELRNRAQSRKDGVERVQEARAGLETYLRNYPLTHEGQAELVRAGLAAERVEDLARVRHRLVGLSIDSRSWLDDFRDHFQGELDRAALARVNGWSLKAAGCVIASPLPLLDSALVLGISLKMLRDLCVLYNVRASRTGCLVLFCKAVGVAFIAGVAEDGVEAAGGVAAEELSQVIGEGAVNSMGARMAGIVAPKLGEGAINAFFIRRLGKAAVRMLQPLRPKAVKKSK